MDVYNAFDLVLHEHLLLKIQKYGINGQIRIGIRAYPENRKQKVVIRGFELDKLDILRGMPCHKDLS